MDGNSSICGTESCSSAVKLLKDDQIALTELFSEYEQVEDYKKKEEIVSKISMALSSYFTLETDVVYPALVSMAVFSQDVCAGAESHHQAKLILDQLQRLTADIDASSYGKAVQALSATVKKHFAEERQTFFPAIDRCSEKAEELNQQLKQFKAERST